MYLAIDIGATKTLIALFSKKGRVMRRIKFPTPHGSKTFISNLKAALANFQKYNVSSITIAVPGVVQKNCSVVFGNRNWGVFDVSAPVKSLFACPIYVENDANLAAIYEAYRLPGRTVFLTFSTGIGGGIVEGGKLLVDTNFEPGHRKYEYGGVAKEWEDIAAASAIGKHYHVDAATDLRGKAIMHDIAARIYLGLPDIARELCPDTIVLGGPMGKIFRLYSRYLPKIPRVKYRRPKRPNESVIYGCYIYTRQKERE